MNDLRFACRQLLKNPGFTAVAVLTLALGTGANTAIFTMINALMLRSLPVRDARKLVQASVAGARDRSDSFSYPTYERLREAATFSALFAAGGIGQGRMIGSGMGATETEFIRSQPVTGNFFSVLEVQPFLGRLFDLNDDQANRAEAVVVVSHGFWQQRFGGDPSVVGKTITLDDVPVAIIGVTPPGFFGVQPGERPDLWWPIHLAGQVQHVPLDQALGEGYDWLRVIGRLRRGVDIRQAQTELAIAFNNYRTDRAGRSTAKSTPEERQHFVEDQLRLQPAGGGWTPLRDRFRQPLMVLAAVVCLVLLIACANVASLMLARGAARTREFSVRAALGADRLRLIRQLLTESVLLAGMGGLFGLVVAHSGAKLLVSFVGVQSDPISFDLSTDARVLGFMTALSLATGVVFGIVPALRASRSDLITTMGGASSRLAGMPSGQFFQQSLVVTQIAMSVVLLAVAGLSVRTLQELKTMDMGFSREGVVLLQTSFGQRVDPLRRFSVYKQLLSRLEAIPGASSASISRITPLTRNTWGQRLDIEGYTPSPDEIVRCNGMSVAQHYFETMGTRLLSGRDFGRHDERPDVSTATNAVAAAIVNEALARKYFGNTGALGHRFSFSGNPGRKFEIIGVVKDAKYRSLREPAPPTFYLFFFAELKEGEPTFAVRMAGKPAGVNDALLRAVREADSTLQVRQIMTMEDVLNASVQRERIVAHLVGFFSVTALALACLGLYGTLSFSVVERTREIGIRIALGAQRGGVLSLVVGQGLKLGLVGAAIGLAGALAGTRLVSSLLYGVSPTDPATFVGVLLLLLIVAVLASWLPARRAAKVDPMEALRYD